MGLKIKNTASVYTELFLPNAIKKKIHITMVYEHRTKLGVPSEAATYRISML